LFIIVKASLTTMRKLLEGWWSIFQSLVIEEAVRALLIVPDSASGIATLLADKYHVLHLPKCPKCIPLIK